MKTSAGKIEEIKAIAEECKGIARQFKGEVKFSSDYISGIESSVDTLVNSPQPRLMVCGVYSAGKSTLVNVLCRKAVASVAAQPETDKVTEYSVERGDYILIDSPGVNAPIEHEQITDEAVKNSHAIMFVISSKNVEDKQNYLKIKEWMKYDKPLIIVMNDKEGGDLNDESKGEMLKKIVSNLKECGYSPKSERFRVFVVNAKRAYGVLFEGKNPKLFDLSNIPMLENGIDGVMSDGYAVLLAPIGELQQILDKMESDFSTAATGSDEQLSAQLENIKNEQNHILDNLKYRIRDDFESQKQQLIDICLSATSQEELDAQSAQVMEAIVKRVESDYNSQISRFAGVVNANLTEYGINMSNDGTVKVKDAEFNINDIMSNVDELFADDPDAADALKKILAGASLGGMVGGALTSILGTAAVEAGVEALAGTALTSLAAGGLGALGGGALAGLPLGPIGLVVGAIGGLIGSIFGGRRKREQQEAAMRRQLEEANRQRQEAIEARYKQVQSEVGALVSKAAESSVEQISALFTAAVSMLEKEISKKLTDAENYNDRIMKAKEKITVLKARLNAVKSKM